MDTSRTADQYTFVVFDIETTGLNIQSHAIIEIGAVKATIYESDGNIETFSKIAQLPDGVRNDAQHVNKITPEMIAGGIPLVEALRQFISFIDDAILMGHNVLNFDLPFVKVALHKEGLPSIDNTVIDTLQLARKFYPNFASYKLGDLANIFNIELSTQHRGLDDSHTTWELFKYMVGDHSFMGAPPVLSKLL